MLVRWTTLYFFRVLALKFAALFKKLCQSCDAFWSYWLTDLGNFLSQKIFGVPNFPVPEKLVSVNAQERCRDGLLRKQDRRVPAP